MVYIPSTPSQVNLIPVDIRTIIPSNHICYLIEDVVNQLDYSKFDRAVEGAGNPSYHPRIMAKILLYGICERITSTRTLEKMTMENVIFRYLSENLHPNFHTIAMFRKSHGDLIKQCFLHVLTIAKDLDMVNYNKLYLDGTKLKANASKSKLFSKEEIDQLSDFVDNHLKEMDAVDEKEDSLYGESDGEPRIPEHLTKRSKLREKVKEMLKDMERSKQQLDKAKQKIIQEGVDAVNLTDSDSALMKMKKGIHYEQGYNCQLLTEDKGELIVAVSLSDSPTDVGETVPVMERFKQEQEATLKDKDVFLDNGYSSPNTAEYFEKEGAIAYIPDQLTTQEFHGKLPIISRFHIDNFHLDENNNQAICPEGHRMNFFKRKINNRNNTSRWTNVYKTDKCSFCIFRTECITKGSGKNYRYAEINPHMKKIRLRLKTKEGREKYNQRFHKGEVAQAHILHNLGFRAFQTRGKKSCETELNLAALAYNLKKIHIKLRETGRNISITVQKLIFWLRYEYFLWES